MTTSSSKSDMKGFYKQKKKNTKSKRKSTPSYASNATQSPPNLKGDCDDKEEMLRKFDMNMAYGPCIGMCRLQRWERAKALGLNPPEDIEALLTTSEASLNCLWDGRI